MPEVFTIPKRARVKSEYRTVYHHPISFREGDSLLVGRYDDQYPGWVWTTTPDGNSGWAPESAVEINGSNAVARQSYDAHEMDVIAGETLTLTMAESGWYWAEKDNGESGWVPAEHLQLLA